MREAFILDTFIGPAAFAAIPKCGQHTLNEYMRCMVQHGKLRKFPIRLAFIREPFDRFLSAFHFMAQTQYIFEGQRIRDYPAFVDLSLTSHDEHVLPQSDILDCDLFPTRLCLSSMCDVLGRLTGRQITVENSSIHNPIDTNYRKDEVMVRYSEDVEMYENRTVI